LALVESGLDRGEAYRLVQRNAMRAWDEERNFGKLVRADVEISSRLDDAALSAIFDLQSAVQHVDAVFERLRPLAAREAVVHV
jgi:adenylosuccinate lyase